MTQEEKAKAYDEAIERAKSKIKNDKDHVLYEEDITDIFPILKESEDERIRKDIIAHFKDDINELTILDSEDYEAEIEELKKYIAWLEKQGEQKPSEDEDREYACQSSEHYTRRELMIYNLGIADGKRMIEDAIKETEQKPAWSEEDEKILKDIIIDVKYEGYNNDMQANSYKKTNWLKKIKDRVQPHNTWLPSDGQIEALSEVVSDAKYRHDISQNGYEPYKPLLSLLQDLKKLKE